MKRLTQADWQIINTALAYYDAQDRAGEFGYEDNELEAENAAIAAARLKVWERL